MGTKNAKYTVGKKFYSNHVTKHVTIFFLTVPRDRVSTGIDTDTATAAGTHVVIDEVEVVARRDGHRSAAAARHAGVGVVQRLVDEHERVVHGVAVRRRVRHALVRRR